MRLVGLITLGLIVAALATVSAQPWKNDAKMGMEDHGAPGAGMNVRVNEHMHENWMGEGKGLEKAKERYENASKKFQKAKEMYEKAKERREKAFEYGKKYMHSWTNLCERWIEKLMVRIQTSNMGEDVKLRIMERLRNALGKIEEVEKRINSSTNYTELREAVREMRNVWHSLRVELRLSAYEYALWRFENVVERIEQLRDRFESVGLDVSKIDEKLEKVKELIDEAKSSIDEGNAIAARDKIAQIRFELKNMFAELKLLAKDYAGRVVLGYESGVVYAKVNGSFELSGNVTVLVRGEGDVTVTPESAIVTKVEKDGYVKVLARGEVTVSGDGEFRIVAHGKGVLNLNGEGYYRVKENISTPMSEEKQFEGSTSVKFGVIE